MSLVVNRRTFAAQISGWGQLSHHGRGGSIHMVAMVGYVGNPAETFDLARYDLAGFLAFRHQEFSLVIGKDLSVDDSHGRVRDTGKGHGWRRQDRKSTRLNCSH